MSQAFTWTEIRNCRRFHKRYYTLSRPIDQELVDQMECFGLPQITRFSQYAPQARDTFRIFLDDEIELSGTIEGHDFYVTVSKKSPETLAEVEATLTQWFRREERKAS